MSLGAILPPHFRTMYLLLILLGNGGGSLSGERILLIHLNDTRTLFPRERSQRDPELDGNRPKMSENSFYFFWNFWRAREIWSYTKTRFLHTSLKPIDVLGFSSEVSESQARDGIIILHQGLFASYTFNWVTTTFLDWISKGFVYLEVKLTKTCLNEQRWRAYTV